ncbi:MAG TPA: hypothetical protein VMM35_13025 [Longimicrobiales bacterium]|nr:hypothetical protein [Longimicrobiales bacterium]
MRKALLLGIALVLAADARAQDVPTWTAEVGPLMRDKCMNCHRPGEVAPMSLLTYEEVRPWARSIRTMVEDRIMPPWHADPAYGVFGNNRRMTPMQINTISQWVDAGAPRGEGEFTPPEFPEGWLLGGVLGEPDYVFEMEEPFVVPAGGEDINIDIIVPTTHTEDIWVQAAEVRGNSRVMHHNVVSVILPDGSDEPTGRLASATPGKQWDRFPDGAAKLIPAGSKMSFGLHYHPSNEVEEDVSRVAVWLVRRPITHAVYSSVVADPALDIPPYEESYESRGEFVFERDAEITLMKPHMHYRGKDMRYDLVYPDGRRETILSVPDFDMNWQISYELAEPLAVPAGTRLQVIAHFDNSERNPWNPDPSVRVIWGPDSRDEMMEGWFDYRVELEEPVVPPSARRITDQGQGQP